MNVVLYAFGVIPGLLGVIAGFASYVLSQKPNVIMPSFMLLELGALALLKKTKQRG